MKRHFKILLIAMFAITSVCIFGTAICAACPEPPPKDTSAPEMEVDPTAEYTQEEYDCYDAAVKEKDPLKQGSILMKFIEKYPKSKLMPHIESAYNTLLFECSTEKKYEELEKLAEQWLKIHPNEIKILAYIADATEKLGKYEKFVQRLQEIYKLKPSGDSSSGSYAYTIAMTYRDKLKNIPKFLEWTEIVLKYPEFKGDFGLRFELMKSHYDPKSKPTEKAIEYVHLTLASINEVKDPDAETEKSMREIRQFCYDLIARSLMSKDKYAEAIASFKQALKINEYADGYFQIARCFHNLNKGNDAMLWYAKTELWCKSEECKEIASSAKRNLEQIYRKFHDGEIIGIEKEYKKAEQFEITQLNQ